MLMALSNKFGWLVVATGNKSELSVGYATLYGDMAGGFALLKDVFKTDVFRLARHLNERAGRELIPQSIIDRPPSAELRADQLDEDSLPPYPQLDKVLEAYVELDRAREDSRRTGSSRTSSRRHDDEHVRQMIPRKERSVQTCCVGRSACLPGSNPRWWERGGVERVGHHAPSGLTLASQPEIVSRVELTGNNSDHPGHHL